MLKRLFLVLAMLAISLVTVAQNKKVAILETVDKEGNVPYGVRLQLRSSLTYAISSTSGYEGFDRVSLSQIMDEQKFQRTGMVSDSQIKKIGEMTGCGSILVAEVAVYDATHIVITAKILNVETAGIEASAPPKIAGTDPDAMQEACTKLAAMLLPKKEKRPAPSTNINSESAPEIVMTDPNGIMRKLSDLSGNIVLIDFWASWCQPCRIENPNIVRLYHRYHDKGFEIYSVSLDKYRNQWLSAINQDGLVWPNHVSDLNGWTSSGGAAYGVTSIPATVLVDRQGRIIARNLRGQELENKLREIFGD